MPTKIREYLDTSETVGPEISFAKHGLTFHPPESVAAKKKLK